MVTLPKTREAEDRLHSELEFDEPHRSPCKRQSDCHPPKETHA